MSQFWRNAYTLRRRVVLLSAWLHVAVRVLGQICNGPAMLFQSLDAHTLPATPVFCLMDTPHTDAAPSAPPSSPYTPQRIAWELDRTAMGDGFHGNALRVAKDIEGITAEERATLDRWATGGQAGLDGCALQDIAIKIRLAAQAVEVGQAYPHERAR